MQYLAILKPFYHDCTLWKLAAVKMTCTNTILEQF